MSQKLMSKYKQTNQQITKTFQQNFLEIFQNLQQEKIFICLFDNTGSNVNEIKLQPL